MADAHIFHLTVASVGETRFDGSVRTLTAPGSSGVLTVLAHHEPIVTTLKKGTLVIVDAHGVRSTIDIESGVLEVAHNRAVVLL
jgi:F-type H+-transporting ATPase subunit epsilon